MINSINNIDKPIHRLMNIIGRLISLPSIIWAGSMGIISAPKIGAPQTRCSKGMIFFNLEK